MRVPRLCTFLYVNVVVPPRYVARMQPGSGGLQIDLRAEPPQTKGARGQRTQGRRRRLKRCGAPPQAADSRCAKLNAIFGSAVLALSTNFGTNRLALGLSPALRLSLHSESVRRREGSRSGLRTPLCADKRYGAE